MSDAESLKDLHITVQCLKNEMTGADKERVSAAKEEYQELLDEFYEEYEDMIAPQQYEAAGEDPDYFLLLIQLAYHYPDKSADSDEEAPPRQVFARRLFTQVLGGVMKNHSRIRFNPATQEIEIEGTEEFVKTHLERLRTMLAGTVGEKTAIGRGQADPSAPAAAGKKKPRAARAAVPKRTQKADERKPGGKKATPMAAVIGIIQKSPQGISAAELREKTGLSAIQIGNIVNRALKEGRIRKVKRGLYGAMVAAKRPR